MAKISDKNLRTPFQPTLGTQCPKAGFICFRDKKTVTIYTNDLQKTPPKGVTCGSTKEAQDCTYNTVFIRRWLGDEILERTAIVCLTPFVVYNLYMNAVDKFDQIRSTNPTQRREKRLPMSLFTATLDWAVNNAYALYYTNMLQEK